ncbi:MAG: PEP-CTERM-box response regulator transcription factor, partial [Gammaproteobacteria bacterium]|nr:PEP-CTERM-box response regulator transcription factor [Gammaproteobacteria bacterium]NIR88807.1 PEP-CTERM-box response regulator transcription factor [Gammaproteobacteria bacterium]NIU06420.1 PEP-CTERM-box response regulator transcription factor [Gammaproteobacteria bacterium]NIV53312.1 PEP-CTERM-box response regulator transcription factor [Gammaproteobacteria bacterium]NIX87693.1 PEP-CTERM-box response regulator transcription factor [Gammaproteobacteria bacterium]
AHLRRHEPPLVTLDLGLPPDPNGVSEGFATLGEIVKLAPHTKVIVITGNADRENAVRAVGDGAYDFYQKPIDAELLQLIIDRAYKLYELEEENRRLARRSASSPLSGIIATSPQMLKACRTVEKVAPTDVTVLLLGESGTGKELIARALHELSNRAAGPFVAINCAAIPETLLESELFGYEKGAFTGATRQVRGKIEYAHGGTLFLDEIGDLPLDLQAKLLRVLQERVIERVGGREEIRVDVRVVGATHQDLSGLIAEERFREDFYYRVSEVEVRIPPLRERDGDTAILARSFLQRFAEDRKRPIKGFTMDALEALEAHAWSGNVRELENRVKRAVVMSEGQKVTAEDLELEAVAQDGTPLNLRQIREEAEQRALNKTLSYVNGNISRAAELLGITRPTLYALLDKYRMRE